MKSVLDTRLHNSSQLAGFAKREDLSFFLNTVAHIQYREVPELAPTVELLDRYRKRRLAWPEYAEAYVALLRERDVASRLPRELFHDGCLLCSEHEPDHCHRRLAAEFLSKQWGGGVEIVHL